ncbi:hypothetical protein JCM33374_g4515 [Metschnikowia sp. JCM 33374]|nr:hypothetical protein JCM33374_g4515 [Metschnikowia sp. JCM 33374]
MAKPSQTSATGTGPSAHAAIDDSKEQIAELTETVELQKSQIRKLRDENTDLKLERMDLKDKITELEKQLAALRAPKPNAVPLPVPQPPKDVLAPTEPPAEPPISHSSSPVKAPVVESPKKANTGDFREALLAWKGWQVDMRSWNGLQGAQAAL